jgi:hypothetical protein
VPGAFFVDRQHNEASGAAQQQAAPAPIATSSKQTGISCVKAIDWIDPFRHCINMYSIRMP